MNCSWPDQFRLTKPQVNKPQLCKSKYKIWYIKVSKEKKVQTKMTHCKRLF